MVPKVDRLYLWSVTGAFQTKDGRYDLYTKTLLIQRIIVNNIFTSGRGQSKIILTIDKHGSKIARNSVFYCHLSPIGRQMAIKNSVSNDF